MTKSDTKTLTTPITRVVPSGDEMTFSVSYLAGHAPGCGDALEVTVEESAAQVVLTARVRYSSDGRKDRFCTLDAILKSDVVTLDKPLGTRILVDGHDGRRLVVMRPSSQ